MTNPQRFSTNFQSLFGECVLNAYHKRVILATMNFEKHQSMNKSVSILDKEYKEWVKDLALRYRNSQIKAAVKVNTEMLKFYWE